MMPFVCWKCGAPLRVDVGQPGGVSKYNRTGREYLFGLASNLFKPRRYEQSQPYAPTIIQQPPAQVGALNPGETAYRVLSGQADIKPQLGMGLVCGGFVAMFGGCVYVFITIPNAWPLAVIGGITDLVAGAVFVRLNWDVLVEGKDTRLVSRERMPETPPVTDPQTVRVKGELHEGRKTIYDELDITDYPAWHRFCKSVHFDGKNFSETQAVKKDKVPPSDWATVSEQWIRRGWLVPAKRRGTPTLQAVGRHWVRAYAENEPGEG